MRYDDLYRTVRAILASRKAVTVIFIQMRYLVLQAEARRCVAQLQDEGLIGREWDASLGGYPVLAGQGEKHGI